MLCCIVFVLLFLLLILVDFIELLYLRACLFIWKSFSVKILPKFNYLFLVRPLSNCCLDFVHSHLFLFTGAILLLFLVLLFYASAFSFFFLFYAFAFFIYIVITIFAFKSSCYWFYVSVSASFWICGFVMVNFRTSTSLNMWQWLSVVCFLVFCCKVSAFF